MRTVDRETAPQRSATVRTDPEWAYVDGNEAAARIAHLLSEVIAIYPITPASPMGELSDAWSAAGRPNLWGTVPEVIEMQSEAGAAGTVHGGLMSGALSTTFTASQGLLLMLPNMFKIAGELTPAVIHVAARSLATHALSIFGDHSDVMAARTTGWAMLASSSVQEAQDMALIAHLATLETRIPFLHFFDGFRTSHEINKIQLVDPTDIEVLISQDAIREHRMRGLSPDRPVLRGSAQNPDVFFQAREAGNPFYKNVPGATERIMQRFGERTGRHYSLLEYSGAPDAERVIVAMGSGTGAIEETVRELEGRGERVGLIKVRLFRPFPVESLIRVLPTTTRSLAVLDRTKEPGAVGEPLYQDVVTTLAEALADGRRDGMPVVIGGRYGLASKEFTPAMVKGVFDELAMAEPKRSFTVGIIDDVTHSNLEPDSGFTTDKADIRALFYGLGSDGTVSASKSIVKIAGSGGRFAQGYSVYDSKKSGSITTSHVRVASEPIESTYLIEKANFIACHQFSMLEQIDVLEDTETGAIVLLNSPYGPDDVWDRLPAHARRTIVERDLELYVIDAYGLARELGLGSRINTIMQPCFFALMHVLPLGDAIAALRGAVATTYGKRGPDIVAKNEAALDGAVKHLRKVHVPDDAGPADVPSLAALKDAPDFVTRVTARMMAGHGDQLPVSAFPPDGTFPTGTTRYEKRCIAQEIPIWDPEICIDCGHCVIVCPHAAIRMKAYEPELLAGAPEDFATKEFHSKEIQGHQLTVQVYPDDCTGCGVCVDVCPVRSKTEVKHKALNMAPIQDHLERERANLSFFEQIPSLDRSLLDPSTVKGSQLRQPLFEFSGACAGCGETPYLKLLTQLFGDRVVVANATGCSSIYGGNLPTTPWSTNEDGRGPAWANSLFEDNAEFGLGMRLAYDKLTERARMLLMEARAEIGEDLVSGILGREVTGDADLELLRALVGEVKTRLQDGRDTSARSRELVDLADMLVPKSVWIVGGDGWAYDIGSAGLDHVLASGRDVNILVLDTEVYSNTGGQASKATPRGAIAKFASRGKATAKKDLGLMAASYGDVYVAQIALGANYTQTIKAFQEAAAWPGPSLIIAYSTCIAHGIEMSSSMSHQKDAVKAGYWPLFRFHPGLEEHGHPFQLDSKRPSVPLRDFVSSEARFSMLARSSPERAERLLDLAQADIDERWKLYEQMAGLERRMPEPEGGENGGRPHD